MTVSLIRACFRHHCVDCHRVHRVPHRNGVLHGGERSHQVLALALRGVSPMGMCAWMMPEPHTLGVILTRTVLVTVAILRQAEHGGA